MICCGHGHLCLTGCSVVTIATAKKVSHGHQNGSLWSSYLKRSVRPRVRVFWLFEINSGPHMSLLEVLITCTHTRKYFFLLRIPSSHCRQLWHDANLRLRAIKTLYCRIELNNYDRCFQRRLYVDLRPKSFLSKLISQTHTYMYTHRGPTA